jgi:PPOX class probable F420-dependent enzyme
VPCCFAIGFEDGALVIDTPIDDKPKTTSDPGRLARVRDIRRDPRASLLVDRWDEDWTRLAWVRVVGTARLLVPWSPRDTSAHASAIEALRSRYPQYREHRLEIQPVIRISVERMTGWDAHVREAQAAAMETADSDDERWLVDALGRDPA